MRQSRLAIVTSLLLLHRTAAVAVRRGVRARKRHHFSWLCCVTQAAVSRRRTPPQRFESSATFACARCQRQEAMPCECRGSSYEVESDPQALWLELGPAYEDYRAGNVSISRTWEPNKGLVGDWLPSCCGELSGDWTFDDAWLSHTIMLACFVAISGTMLGVMIYFRDQQPFKFRDMKAMTMLWLVITFCMINGVMAGNMGGTGPIVPGLVFGFLGPSLMLYHYTIKAVQLYFICSWQEAKMHKASFEKLKTFQRLRYVLEPRIYFIGLGLVAVLFSIPIIYAVTGRQLYSNAAATNGYQTLRCEWWNLPDRYTEPTSSSLLCPCIKLQTPLEGGSQAECVSGVLSLCVNMEGGTAADSGFCDVCFTDLAALAAGPTPECRDWFQKFYLSGSCGFPKQTPHAETCTSGLFADRPIGYTCAAVSYTMLVINVIALIPLYGKRDDFGMITENVGCAVVFCIAIFFLFTGLYPDHGGLMDWYYEDLGLKYREIFLCTFVCGWAFVVMAQAYPLALFAQRRYQAWASHTRKKREGTLAGTKPLPRTSRKADGQSQLSTGMVDSDTNRFANPSGLSRTSSDAEHEVEECIRTPALLQVYGTYAVQAFHAENVQFLADCSAFFDTTHGELNRQTLTMITTSARTLYEQYIAANATLEVNLQSKTRSAILASIAKLEATVAISLDETTNAAPAQSAIDHCIGQLELLVDALATAYADIRRLLARDAWPRFKRSRHYEQYSMAMDYAERVTNAIELIYSGADAVEPADDDHELSQLPVASEHDDQEELEKLTLRMKPIIPDRKSPRSAHDHTQHHHDV